MFNKAVILIKILLLSILVGCSSVNHVSSVKQQRVFKRNDSKVVYSSDVMKVHFLNSNDSLSVQFYAFLRKVNPDSVVYINPLKIQNNDHVDISFFMSVLHEDIERTRSIDRLTFAIDRSFIWETIKFTEMDHLMMFVINDNFLRKTMMASEIHMFLQGEGFIDKLSFDQNSINNIRFFYDVANIHLPKTL